MNRCPCCRETGTLQPVLAPDGGAAGFVRIEVQNALTASTCPIWGGPGIVCSVQVCTNCRHVALFYDERVTHGIVVQPIDRARAEGPRQSTSGSASVSDADVERFVAGGRAADIILCTRCGQPIVVAASLILEKRIGGWRHVTCPNPTDARPKAGETADHFAGEDPSRDDGGSTERRSRS